MERQHLLDLCVLTANLRISRVLLGSLIFSLEGAQKGAQSRRQISTLHLVVKTAGPELHGARGGPTRCRKRVLYPRLTVTPSKSVSKLKMTSM
jgi:hypothetical protein